MTTDGTPKEAAWPAYDMSVVAKHVHAISILSVGYNDLENKLLDFLKLYDGASDAVVAFLFEKMPTETRLDWLRRLIQERKAMSPKLSELILAFIKAYQICTNNRNLIIHSRIGAYFAPDDLLMMSKRVRKHGAEKHHDLDLTTIRRVADEVHFWTTFGRHIIAYVLRKSHARQKRFARPGYKLVGPTALPTISPPPEDLAKRFQN